MTGLDQRQPEAPPWLFESVVFGVTGLLIFCMMAGIEWGLYVSGFLGMGASAILGHLTLQRGWYSLTEGLKRVVILWLYVIGFAALSVLNGKWEPAAFFTVVGMTMTGCYAIGARSGVH